MKDLNPYDIYRPPEESFNQRMTGSVLISDVEKPLKGQGMFSQFWTSKERENLGQISAVTNYLNREDVKSALHIPSKVSWSECNIIRYTKLEKASFWIYPFLKSRIRILHYSGDTDGVVPLQGTLRWMHELGWPVKEEYRSWSVRKYQQGGWFEAREGMDLIVIHGGGHMIPQWKREETTYAIKKWLNGEAL